MPPQHFIAKWGPGGPTFDLNERQGAQPHFIYQCQLLGVPTPGRAGDYLFEQDSLVLGERKLTKLYNQRPAWLDAAHKALDTAVAQAYGWSDYTADMPDEEILKRLLALNLERAGGADCP